MMETFSIRIEFFATDTKEQKKTGSNNTFIMMRPRELDAPPYSSLEWL